MSLLLHEVDSKPVVTVDGPIARSLVWSDGAWRHNPVAGLKALSEGRQIGTVRLMSRHPAAACALPHALDTLAARASIRLKVR